jgi:hypothetical protein
MQGIQRFSLHEKDSGKGLSFSVIFRRLTSFAGQIPQDFIFNEEVKVDWYRGIVPRAWRIRPDVSKLPVGTIFELQQFNKLRLHPVQKCSISCFGGVALSIVLYSNRNVVSACGNVVWFTGYSTLNPRTMALNNILLSTHEPNAVAIYKKLEQSRRQFLGMFYVNKAIKLQQTMYFILSKNE